MAETTEKSRIETVLDGFRLPEYQEIPDVGLYLEQVVRYIALSFQPFGELALTPSMISNYVKKKIIAPPIKKQYRREQIAYLLFIAAAKSVLSMDNIDKLIRLQKERYDVQNTYAFFRASFGEALLGAFGADGALLVRAEAAHDLRMLLQNILLNAANRIYLDRCLSLLCNEEKKKQADHLAVHANATDGRKQGRSAQFCNGSGNGGRLHNRGSSWANK